MVVDSADVAAFQALAAAENLESTVVAEVTERPRLVMELDGRKIVDLSREFLNSNGAKKYAAVSVPLPEAEAATRDYLDFESQMQKLVGSLNIASQKGLAERFDSTIGAGTVLMPFGGKWQLFPRRRRWLRRFRCSAERRTPAHS